MSQLTNNALPDFDPILVEIANYVADWQLDCEEDLETAHFCLMDSLGCAILALKNPECLRHVGPVVPGAVLENGARIPGTPFQLDPVQAAHSIGSMVRWLDYNDTWLAAEWGHPSDNLGAILACADYVNRMNPKHPYLISDVIIAMVKAYEIQGVLALTNSFNRLGIDHVILVKIASTAVAAHLLGGKRKAIVNALSNAWIDGGALRTYRHAPNTGWRKSWAAGDATARAVQHALWAVNGEMGYPSALSAKQWGFEDVLNKGEPLQLSRPLGCYVMENILFKVAYPVEFHAQTAVECAIKLHQQLNGKLDEIDHIELATQEAGNRIINKTGPLHNPADRDHSLQYAVAIGLLFGDLQSHHYSDNTAADTRIDALREKMSVIEDENYSRDYLDPDKRSIANRVTLHMKDGTTLQQAVEYPIGHRRRREEAKPLLVEKLSNALASYYSDKQCCELMEMMFLPKELLSMPVDHFMDRWVVGSI